MISEKNLALTLLGELVSLLDLKKETDPVLSKLHAEVSWLKQELEADRIQLPIKSTQDLYFPRALTEGELDDEIKIKEKFDLLFGVLFTESKIS